MGRSSSGSWVRNGCLTVGGLLLIAAIVLGVASGIAVRQNRVADFEHDEIVPEMPDVDALESSGGTVRLNLEIHTAGLSVRPLAAGEAIRIEADYDPKRFELRQKSERVGETVVMSVEVAPRGSKLMALLRTELGGRPAMVRIGLPRDVRMEIEGRLVRAFAAMELGGLSLTSTTIGVEEGGVKVSFVEPLPTPMESLTIRGNRGSLSVAGLGNASPRETRLLQHVGALDLDLRGAWSRDGKVNVIGGVAGGSLWLPDNANIMGLDENRGIAVAGSELPLPTLDLSISETMGRIIVME